ncbi:MAG TPA: hypothetical protein DCM71_01005 [Runella sp.]|nr:hypothetical protein [Runella sp.]
MKKLLALLITLLCFGVTLDSVAQTETKPKKEKKEKVKDKAEDKKDKKEDKKDKKEDKKDKKEDKADKKEDKADNADKKSKGTKVKPAAKEDDGKEADGSTRKKVAGADKTMGKDDKGRTIYQGPRGGQYYINSNGNKTYLKADDKL